MRNVTRLFATAMLIGWLFGDATAIAAPTEGASEVQVSAGFFHTQGSDAGSLNADLSYGYYVMPGWQLGIRQALNYNFHLTEIIVPYLGAFIGMVWNDRDATGKIGPQAGIKFFVNDRTF